MHETYFFAGQEQQLRDLIYYPLGRDLDHAVCAGMDAEIYHPETEELDEVALARCKGCPARLACLALALRAEDTDARAGWYGGLGPADRDEVASLLQLETAGPVPTDRAVEAARLRASGRTVAEIAEELGCSRRTVQRYLKAVAA